MNPLKSNSLNHHDSLESQPPLQPSWSSKPNGFIDSSLSSTHILTQCKQLLTSSNDALVVTFMKEKCEKIVAKLEENRDPSSKDTSTASEMIQILYCLFNLLYSFLRKVDNKKLISVVNELIGVYVRFSHQFREHHSLFFVAQDDIMTSIYNEIHKQKRPIEEIVDEKSETSSFIERRSGLLRIGCD